MDASRRAVVFFKEKAIQKKCPCIHFALCLIFFLESYIHLSYVKILWTQDVGGMDMGLVERDMHCIAPYMRPICHLMSRLFHAKSLAVQTC